MLEARRPARTGGRSRRTSIRARIRPVFAGYACLRISWAGRWRPLSLSMCARRGGRGPTRPKMTLSAWPQHLLRVVSLRHARRRLTCTWPPSRGRLREIPVKLPTETTGARDKRSSLPNTSREMLSRMTLSSAFQQRLLRTCVARNDSVRCAVFRGTVLLQWPSPLHGCLHGKRQNTTNSC